MKVAAIKFLFVLTVAAGCKKQQPANTPLQLYPLAAGNKWIYIDSFFTENNVFYRLDTFTLKTTIPVNFNSKLFTPITDQFDDSIFTIHCDDTAVYLLKRPDAVLIFKQHLPANTSALISNYSSSNLQVTIYTEKIITTSHPSYKIVIIKDNGLLAYYRKEELYFAPGIGIIKGRHYRYSPSGVLYAYDSFRLYQYSLY